MNGDDVKKRDRQMTSDYNAVLNTAEGQRVIREIIGYCGIYRQSFTGNSETFFREGKRAIGLKILEDVERYAPGKLQELLTKPENAQ